LAFHNNKRYFITKQRAYDSVFKKRKKDKHPSKESVYLEDYKGKRL